MALAPVTVPVPPVLVGAKPLSQFSLNVQVIRVEMVSYSQGRCESFSFRLLNFLDFS